MNYTKRIEVMQSGTVVAEVVCEDGRRVGLSFFSPFIPTVKAIERKAHKAHKWADAYIEMCKGVER